ncbi:MAG: hypothetical protein WCO05_00220 [Candidatus Moraniibacteriota bacterium]
MDKFILGLADQSDDEMLQEVIRSNSMEGKIQLSFGRSPSFFQSVGLLGDESQIIVARNAENKAIVGFGIRSIRRVFLNGHEETIGYLSGLRVAQEYRNRTLLARGYKFLKQLHEDGRASVYLASIMEDNSTAIDLLTSRKACIPISQDLGRYCTFVYRANKKPISLTNAGLEVRRGKADYIGDMLKFLNKHNSKRQFAPCYKEQDFFDQKLFLGLALEDIYLAFRGKRIVGMLAKWDQHAFKQIKIDGYDIKLKYLRPLVNLVAKAKGLPYLPIAGNELDFFYVSLICISSDELGAFSVILNKLQQDNMDRDYSLFMLGMHSGDSLIDEAKKFPHLQYNSRVHMMYWEDQRAKAEKIDRDMVPYLELATL